ncbi:cytidine deaminase-like protein [Myriangium duriaei CBS 260.36]|uniref:Cytidine deaminase-like protein n=1 Tax=Myriangium duriaei CBS 260.36 TaxID=1168546 RepID=A0A9P4MQ90_9PEZI|nr:cytidine deaminase-like protein [Myriangium duriaei CBS 260.36]
MTSNSSSPHLPYMQDCIKLAQQSPPKPSNFRVGALLVALPSRTVLATGYTLELPGNTHAEQSALTKYARERGVADTESRLSDAFPPPPSDAADTELVIYCSMEPCAKRLSGNKSCAQRIVDTRGQGWGVKKVYYGVKEPETFVGESEGVRLLTEAGVELEYVAGLEDEILRVATAGHVQE